MHTPILSFLLFFIEDSVVSFHKVYFNFRLDAQAVEETAMSIVLKGMKSVYFAMVMDTKS